jgi:hypothetical protein
MPGFIMCASGPVFGVLGGDLEIAADVVADQFPDVLRIAHGEVVAQTELISTFFTPGSARALR